MKLQIRSKKQWVGVGLLLAAFLVIGSALYSSLHTERVEKPKETAIETEETLANDARQIDKQEARRKMKLQLQLAPETKKRVPDLEELKTELTDYLIQEGFYTDVTKAISTNVVTEDFNQQIRIFGFTLNNPDQTQLDAVYDQKKGTYTFTYY